MGDIRVLLIENNPTDAQLIERMLELSPIGFRITVAGSLKAAQKELEESRFNLILTDLDLPDTKGLDTIEGVRSTDSAIPIIALINREDHELSPQAISRGAQFCLCKSEINTKSLLGAMHQAVRISRQNVPRTSDNQVDHFVTQLEEDIVVLQNALGTIGNGRLDSQQQDAFQMIRSQVGKIQQRIGKFRQLQH